MKKAIGIVAVVLLAAAAVIGVMTWTVRTAVSAAVDAYNAAVQEYNNKIAPYNEAVAQTASANEDFSKLLDQAEAEIEKGEKPYEEDTIEVLKRAVEKASKAVAEIPVPIDPMEEKRMVNSLNKNELEAVRLEAENGEAAVRKAMTEIPEVPKVPDYANRIASVEKALKDYTDSVQKLKNVTAPADDFVEKRLLRIDTVTKAVPVSKGHDPNELLGKKGGYIGCVYFTDKRIDPEILPKQLWYREETQDGETEEEQDAEETEESSETNVETAGTAQSGSADASGAAEDASAATAETAASAETAAETAVTAETAAADASGTGETAAAEQKDAEEPDSPERLAVIAAGTAGGGAVEIYSTEKEARERDEYLAFFEGSVMDPGAHTVEGTCVIRASLYLEDAQQQELMEAVRKALLAVDE